MSLGRENKPHIGFFGRCNVGKSTLLNLLVGQEIAIVSSQKGTTTDIVTKTMELYNVGPVVLVDSAGLDDDSMLADKRLEKTLKAVNLVDLAIIIVTNNCFGDYEKNLIKDLENKKINYLFAYNKQSLYPINQSTKDCFANYNKPFIIVDKNELSKQNLTTLLAEQINTKFTKPPVLQSLLKKDDIVVLVTPIDSSAPKDRMILPQVQAIRQVLDNKAINIVLLPEQLEFMLKVTNIKPKLVITDSQVFDLVAKIVDKNTYLTSFSVLLAKQKGLFSEYIRGVKTIKSLQDNDNILMLENCTHQPTCEDIGRKKLPTLLQKHTGKKLNCTAMAGIATRVEDINKYKLVIQCGGCVATEQQLFNSLQPFVKNNIPITNYGLAIAYCNGILQRAIKIFEDNGLV